MGTTPNAAETAKKALDSANNFTDSVTKQAGNKTNPLHKAAKPAAATSDYSHVRTQRANEGHEFMGVRSDEGAELKAAQQNRENADKALAPQ